MWRPLDDDYLRKYIGVQRRGEKHNYGGHTLRIQGLVCHQMRQHESHKGLFSLLFLFTFFEA